MEHQKTRKKRHKILVIEFSETEFLEICDILLERYEIQQMCFGEEVFSLIRGSAPDLILLDCETKKLDWYKVVKSLKKDDIAAKIPIIFINRSAKQAEILKGFLLLFFVDFRAHFLYVESNCKEGKVHLDLVHAEVPEPSARWPL